MKDRAHEIALNPKYDGYQRKVASTLCRFFDKKTGSGVTATSKARTNANEVLVQELHKAVTKTFLKISCKV